MEINSDSWHYKFYKLGYGAGHVPYRTNLCSYFWRTVLGLGIAVFVVLFVLACLGIVGFVAYHHTAIFFTGIGGLVAVFGLIMLNEYWGDAEPGLLRAYLRAKKEKVCPLVEIV